LEGRHRIEIETLEQPLEKPIVFALPNDATGTDKEARSFNVTADAS